MTKSRADDETRLLGQIRTLIRAFLVNERAFPSAEGRMAFNPQVFQALFEIDASPGIRALDLGRRLGLVPTTASSLIARLVRGGLVEKRASRSDGRAVALFLTAKGAELRAAIDRQDRANMALMLSGLTPGERAQLLDLLDKVAATVRAGSLSTAAAPAAGTPSPQAAPDGAEDGAKDGDRDGD